ncbi:hypothetical protein IAT38_004624 [Cryptococcus sp. DSM 104549]
MAAPASASTLKRPAPSSSLPDPKRARASESPEEEEDDGVGEEGMDEATLAKKARKDARTIRNRQSAQRSRENRKKHLIDMEKRLAFLEAENAALKSGSASSPSPSASAATSIVVTPPPNSTSVSTDVSGGVQLSSVAPPPADLQIDVKPDLMAAPASSGDALEGLKAENARLKEKVVVLEDLVKRVVSAANLSGLGGASAPAPAPSYDAWSFLSAPASQGLETTLSPSYPSVPPSSTVVSSATPSSTFTPSLSLFSTPDLVSSTPSSSNLFARHSAVVATSPSSPPPAHAGEEARGKALQRAKGTYSAGLAAALGMDFAFGPEFTDGLFVGEGLGAGPAQGRDEGGEGGGGLQEEIAHWDAEMMSLFEGVAAGESESAGQGQGLPLDNVLQMDWFGVGATGVVA